MKSRSRDRRGRDVVSSRGTDRAAEPVRREKAGRNRDADRRMMVRGRDGYALLLLLLLLMLFSLFLLLYDWVTGRL